MKHLKKQLTILLLALLTGAAASAQQAADSLYTFRFVQGQDMFYVPWQGNGGQLEALVTLLSKYKEEVAAGKLPVNVDGYCTGQPSREENLRMAAVRSNRVKTEIIRRTGLTEACFTTANYNDTYRRQDNDAAAGEDNDAAAGKDNDAAAGKDNDTPKGILYNKVYEEMQNVVIVTLRLPRHAELVEASTPQAQPGEEGEEILHFVQNDSPEAQAAQHPEAQTAQRPEAQPAQHLEAQPTQHPEAQPTQHPEAATAQPLPAFQEKESASSASSADEKSSFSLRTNLLYDAFLLPTLGIEWRISPSVAIKLDGSLSRWGGSEDKVQKIWLLNPEVRWYLLRDKRFYLGASGSYGEYNIYKYMLGNLLKDDTGYQGSLWNAGLTVGYSLPLCPRLCLDFNLGLGYTHSAYDSFGLTNGIRVFKGRDKTKNFWGPTQAGISLVWVLGNYK